MLFYANEVHLYKFPRNETVIFDSLFNSQPGEEMKHNYTGISTSAPREAIQLRHSFIRNKSTNYHEKRQGKQTWAELSGSSRVGRMNGSR